MGELVDAKGRVRFFCECCGGVSHNSHYCVSCEPPDTQREGRGRKWWEGECPSSRRSPLSRNHIVGVVEAPKRRRGRPPGSKTKGADRVPTAEEMPFLHAMINAIRESLGMGPLYGVDKKLWSGGGGTDSNLAIFDERDGEWKR